MFFVICWNRVCPNDGRKSLWQIKKSIYILTSVIEQLNRENIILQKNGRKQNYDK